MKRTLVRIRTWVVRHKAASAVVAIIICAVAYGAVRASVGTESATRYVLAVASRGDIASTVTGTGQVEADQQISLASKSSGDVVAVLAAAGQDVRSGSLIARIDGTDAVFELENARLSLQDLTSVDPEDLQSAIDKVENASSTLTESYIDAQAALTELSASISTVMNGLGDLFDGYLSSSNRTLTSSKRDYIERAEDSYYAADDVNDGFTKAYVELSPNAGRSEIDMMLSSAAKSAESMAEAAKLALDAAIYLRDRESSTGKGAADSAYESAESVVTAANQAVSRIASAKSAITSGTQNLRTAESALADLRNGPDELELRTRQLAVKQKEDAVADTYVRAPFDGTVASVSVKTGDTVSNGTAVATIITKKKAATISLNEIDAAKVGVGQQATVTFDAIDGLEIAGHVAEVDLVGTVSQGVVSYNVVIAFDVEDPRIKVGMTANASIVTDTRTGVIAVPATALQTRGRKSYIQVVDGQIGGKPGTGGSSPVSGVTLREVEVETGFSNDDMVEVVSGLAEGDRYVVRTVTVQSSASGSQPASPSNALFGGGGRSATGELRTSAGAGGATFRQFTR